MLIQTGVNPLAKARFWNYLWGRGPEDTTATSLRTAAIELPVRMVTDPSRLYKAAIRADM